MTIKMNEKMIKNTVEIMNCISFVSSKRSTDDANKPIMSKAKTILAIIFCLLTSFLKSSIDLLIVPYNMLLIFKPKANVLLLKSFL
jgi:hypothetical protein